ncbi:MAG: LysM peptidoglycan-binding domain-containing protein [Oscillospiraceae bacterium]|nr:LysM peptidoglycan-binding domain-containing protein [Oscillospiraceae bacterium]
MYSFFIGDIRLPVAPERFSVNYGQNIRRVELASGREVTLPVTPRPPGSAADGRLAKITFTAMLPWREYPFANYSGGFRCGDLILGDLLRVKERGEPFRFIVRRKIGRSTKATYIMNVFLESLHLREDAVKGSDIYVDITLLEHRAVQAVRVISGTYTPTVREGAVSIPRTYTVVSGDSLWLIAHRFFSDGNRWREIYESNRALIDGRNRGTGNPYHTIYPGQVLTIP